MKKTIILLFFFGAFYIQNRYAIFSIDDWTYSFMVNPNARNYQSVVEDNVIRQPITSLYDAIISQSRDYFKTNGRFIIHTLTQYFCGTMAMQEFVIFNSIIFILFTLLVIKVVNYKFDVWNLLLLLSSIWILFPHKGLTFMGNITCSLDYLWSSVGTLLFTTIYIHISHKQRVSIPVLIFYSIYAIIAGSLQESFSFGLSGALIIYLIWKNFKTRLHVIIVSFAYILGTSFCMISPANFRRFDDIGGMGFHSNSLLGFASSPIIIIFILCILFIIYKKKFKESIENNFIIIVPIFINSIFALFIAYNGRHQLTAINMFSLIFIFRIWMEYASNNLKKIICYIFTCFAIISYYPILSARRSYYNNYMKIIERVNKNKIICGTEFEENTDKINQNRILECNYIATFTFQNWDFFERSLSIYLTKGKDNKLIKEVRR